MSGNSHTREGAPSAGVGVRVFVSTAAFALIGYWGINGTGSASETSNNGVRKKNTASYRGSTLTKGAKKMKDIYRDRSIKIDGILDSLMDSYNSTTDGEVKKQVLYDIKTLSDIDNNLAKTMVAIEANELKSQEITLTSVESNEKHEIELKELEGKEADRDLRKQENDIRNREVDIKEKELLHIVEKDAADKEVSEQKLDVEKRAVIGRVAGEGLKVVGTVVGAVATVASLKAVMKFEKAEDGGIIPSKLMSLIFKNL